MFFDLAGRSRNEHLFRILDGMCLITQLAAPIVFVWFRDRKSWKHFWYCIGVLFVGKAVAQIVTYLPYSGGYEVAEKTLDLAEDFNLANFDFWSLSLREKIRYFDVLAMGGMVYSGHMAVTVTGFGTVATFMRRRGV